MKEQGPILAGVFAIEDTDAELVAGVKETMAIIAAGQEEDDTDEDEIEIPEVLDLRRMSIALEEDETEDSPQPMPVLYAMALTSDAGNIWMVRGDNVIAVIPIKGARKPLSALTDWAETFSPEAAFGLVAAAYPHLDDDVEDDSIHLILDLPLDGISMHRPKEITLEKFLDDLGYDIEEALEQIEVDSDAALYSSDDAIVGHISVYLDDEERAIQFVRDAALDAFTEFTPKAKVHSQLVVKAEGPCLYDIVPGVTGEDLPD